VWADIGINFIEALPKVQSKTIILSLVDCFSKYCHFIPLAHPYTADVAHAFFTDIVHLHGVLQPIVSDRDPVFTSAFWQELMRLIGTKLYMSFAFHPQTDGQTEATNRVIVMYLNRHRRYRSASTTSTTCQCPSRSAIGLFFAFGSWLHPSHARQQGSSSRDTSGRTRWRSSSTRWRCGYSFLPALAFMMCSMSASLIE
jgi:hypothetical protein